MDQKSAESLKGEGSLGALAYSKLRKVGTHQKVFPLKPCSNFLEFTVGEYRRLKVEARGANFNALTALSPKPYRGFGSVECFGRPVAPPLAPEALKKLRTQGSGIRV